MANESQQPVRQRSSHTQWNDADSSAQCHAARIVQHGEAQLTALAESITVIWGDEHST